MYGLISVYAPRNLKADISKTIACKELNISYITYINKIF
jgi:hypothetical protein